MYANKNLIDVVCYRCRGKGHIAKFCHLKDRNHFNSNFSISWDKSASSSVDNRDCAYTSSCLMATSVDNDYSDDDVAPEPNWKWLYEIFFKRKTILLKWLGEEA